MTNISYELAKELKEMGFPQRGVENHCYIEKEDNAEFSDLVNGIINQDKTDNYIYIPTLSELIEWCGDNLQLILPPHGSGFGIRGWAVATDSRAFNGADLIISNDYMIVTGTTFEEAVARLGIAIHGKKDI